MNSSEFKLLELLKADEESGVIRFKHRRMLIFDADALGLLRSLKQQLGITFTGCQLYIRQVIETPL
jgi:hypothetical protein